MMVYAAQYDGVYANRTNKPDAATDHYREIQSGISAKAPVSVTMNLHALSEPICLTETD